LPFLRSRTTPCRSRATLAAGLLRPRKPATARDGHRPAEKAGNADKAIAGFWHRPIGPRPATCDLWLVAAMPRRVHSCAFAAPGFFTLLQMPRSAFPTSRGGLPAGRASLPSPS
jgi:hypothetical protein